MSLSKRFSLIFAIALVVFGGFWFLKRRAVSRQYLAPQFVQDKAQEILNGMIKCAKSHRDISPAALSDFSDVKVYQGRRQELFDKPHALGIGKHRRSVPKKDGIDFPKNTFTDEASFSGIPFSTLIHELGHVFYADHLTKSKTKFEQKEKEFRAENIAICASFEMGLFDAVKIEMVMAPAVLIPFETKEFRSDRRTFYSLGYLNGLSRYKKTEMYEKLLETLKTVLSKRNDPQKVTDVVEAFKEWNPVKNYQAALEQYDEISSQIEHLGG